MIYLEKKNLILVILALAIGTSGLGMGIYSIVTFQGMEGPIGPPGPPGEDGSDGIDGIDGEDGINGTDGTDGVNGVNGTDGIDAPGSIILGILNPNHQTTISGVIEIKVLVVLKKVPLDYSFRGNKCRLFEGRAILILRSGTNIASVSESVK